MGILGMDCSSLPFVELCFFFFFSCKFWVSVLHWAHALKIFIDLFERMLEETAEGRLM
jgi:hypothetical protein